MKSSKVVNLKVNSVDYLFGVLYNQSEDKSR